MFATNCLPRLLGLLACIAVVQPTSSGYADELGDRLLAEYFVAETEKLEQSSLAKITSEDDWTATREELRQQLFDMLGLDPLPLRTDLKPVVTGKLEHDEFVVEKLHFQSLPGLYVTANLYLPKSIDAPLPGVLYVCGHGRVAKDGISYGNKTHYQHHGAWLARNGYVCLIIDTLQLGEIEGLHHGTYRQNDWWWINRGYTPAGVEAWNCIRALDYLQSRSEVDGTKLAVTGRSGGGAYSWWTAALDERIGCAIPVAGITDLRNHVVDGCVEGHCDCMFMVNTYRWDYPQVAALVSPRPLLISNTDTDSIFPLDGVVRTFDAVRRIYRLQGAGDACGLNITAGGHVDTQELQVHALRWLDMHLKGEKSRLIETAAVKFFEPEQLRVFSELPEDQRNTTIQEDFVPLADAPMLPTDKEQWSKQRAEWLNNLQHRTFRGWPSNADAEALAVSPKWVPAENVRGVQSIEYTFTSQSPYQLSLHVLKSKDESTFERVELHVLDEAGWKMFMKNGGVSAVPLASQAGTDEAVDAAREEVLQDLATSKTAHVYFVPRCIGGTSFSSDPKQQIQNRRRFYLLGQTLEGMQVWDVRRAIQAVRQIDGLKEAKVVIHGEQQMGAIAMLATLFEPPVEKLVLNDLPNTFHDGPILMNVDRVWTMPTAVAVAAERTPVELHSSTPDAWQFPIDVAAKLGWGDDRIQLRESANAEH